MMFPRRFKLVIEFDEDGNCVRCGNAGTPCPPLDMICEVCESNDTRTPLERLAERMREQDEFEPNRLSKALEEFSKDCHEKMMEGYDKGRRGWDDPEWVDNHIVDELHKHIEKGDPRDVAILAMFWWNRQRMNDA